jgi:hypothetical protein
MAETFQVDFTANDQLSSVLKRVSDELERTYLASDYASQSLSKFASAMSKTAKVDIGKVTTELGQFVNAANNTANIGNSATGLDAFAKALSKIGKSNLGNTASELSVLVTAMVKMSTVGSPAGLIATMNALKSASFAKLATQMDRLAISTSTVAKNMQAIAQATSQLPATNIVVRNQNTNPSTPQPSSGRINSGGGVTSANSTFQSTLHLYNSVSFAISTVTSALSKMYDVIERGNELEKSQVTLLGLVQSAGLIPSATAAMKYGQALSVAYGNQNKFGGSLKENIDALLVFQQMSNTTGVSVQKLNDIINLLALRDPAQGIQGATIALQELMSGDPMSLRRRFELPAKEVNKLANYAGDANAQIAGLTELLKNQGITADVLNARLNTTAASYDRLSASASNSIDIIGQSTANLLKPLAEGISGFFATNALMMQISQDAAKDVGRAVTGKEQIDATRNMTLQQKAYYDQVVKNGYLDDAYARQRIANEEHVYAVSVAMDAKARLLIAERNRLARIAFVESTGANSVIAGITTNIDDMIDKQRQSNETKSTEVVLNAAVRASELGHKDAAERLSRIRGITIEQAKEIIQLKLNENIITQEQADMAMGLSVQVQTLSDAYKDLIDSMIKSNQESLKQQNVTSLLDEANKALIGGTLQLSTAQTIIANAFGITNDKAKELLLSMMGLTNFDMAAITRKITGIYIPGTEQFYGGQAGQAQREMLRSYSNVDLGKGNAAYMENVNRILNASLTKKTGVIKDNNDKMLQIEQDAMNKLLAFDEDSYRKRIRALQSYYATTLQMQQMQSYEMIANDLDLVEARGSEIDAKEKQRLLARENIEAYHQLKTNEAVRTANEIAASGEAKFAQTYLSIQEEKFAKEDELAWKYHDTQVRLNGDEEALGRAKTIYEKSLAALDEYYGTKTSIAEAARRDESEAERMQRKQIIADAIDAVKNLTNVDDKSRKNIIDNLTIAGNSINDLSGKYVAGVDAMRGSLELLAAAMLKVKENASILTPEQLGSFNGMPSGIGGVKGDISITDSNNISTVNVGGITVSITNQADANEIAKTVLGILQSQIDTRRP